MGIKNSKVCVFPRVTVKYETEIKITTPEKKQNLNKSRGKRHKMRPGSFENHS